MTNKKTYSFLQGLWRKIKLKYYQLMRSKGGTSTIARSFAIGMVIEFITLPTFGLAFFLLFPLIKWFRGVWSVALIGFIMGKLILPLFLVLNYGVGEKLLSRWEFPSLFMGGVGQKGIAFLVGSFVDGVVMAVVCYFLVTYALTVYRKTKEKKRAFRQNQKFVT